MYACINSVALRISHSLLFLMIVYVSIYKSSECGAALWEMNAVKDVKIEFF